MSTITDLIFKEERYYLSSPYGYRGIINTKAGATSDFHNGADYATYNKKLPQYALEDGTVLSCGRATDGALYVWVSYPRIGKKFLHYHLDSISVKAGQTVKRGTLLGTTGMTGKATGIHLHLGVKDIKTNQYEDPEELKYTEKLNNGLPPAESFDSTARNGKTLKVKPLVGLYLRKAPETGEKIKLMTYNSKVVWYGYYTIIKGVKWYLCVSGTQTGYCSSEYLK